MPAIFELLYKNFCRARLTEMRKQLLPAGKQSKLAQAADDRADPHAQDPQHDAEWGRTPE